MDRWTTEETEDGFRLNYSEDFSVYAYADAAALEEIKDAHNAERDRLAAENAELLAREAELLKKMHPGPRPPIGYPSESAARIKWRHRREFYRSMAAILNPETNDER